MCCSLRAFGKSPLNKKINLRIIIISNTLNFIVKPHLGNTGGDNK